RGLGAGAGTVLQLLLQRYVPVAKLPRVLANISGLLPHLLALALEPLVARVQGGVLPRLEQEHERTDVVLPIARVKEGLDPPSGQLLHRLDEDGSDGLMEGVALQRDAVITTDLHEHLLAARKTSAQHAQDNVV